MDLRQKHICDQIMHRIITSHGQAKFGLSGLATLFNGKASDAEVAEAVQYLLDNNYLRRMQGRGVVGIGGSADLEKYDVVGFDPFSKLPDKAAKPEPPISPDAYKGLQNGGKRPSLSQVSGKTKSAKEKQVDAGEDQKSNLSLNSCQDIENIPTLFGVEKKAREQAEGRGVFEAIAELKKQLNPEPPSNVELKIAVLTELCDVQLDPSICLVLRDIQADYRNRCI